MFDGMLLVNGSIHQKLHECFTQEETADVRKDRHSMQRTENITKISVTKTFFHKPQTFSLIDANIITIDSIKNFPIFKHIPSHCL